MRHLMKEFESCDSLSHNYDSLVIVIPPAAGAYIFQPCSPVCGDNK